MGLLAGFFDDSGPFLAASTVSADTCNADANRNRASLNPLFFGNVFASFVVAAIAILETVMTVL